MPDSRRSAKLLRWLALIGVLSVIGRAPGIPAQVPSVEAGVTSCVVSAGRLGEVSGLVASRRNPDVLWAHDDSGRGPELFAINPSGELLVGYAIFGAVPVDREDIALAPDPVSAEYYLIISVISQTIRQPVAVLRSVASANRWFPRTVPVSPATWWWKRPTR